MSAYAEIQNDIRVARAKRDKARSDLYNLLLQQLKLLRMQRKANRQEIASDPATLAEIAALHEQINADVDRIRHIEASLRALPQLEQEVLRDQAALENLTTIEFDKLQTLLGQNETTLNKPSLDQQHKAVLEEQRTKLFGQLELLRSQMKEWRLRIAEKQENLQAAIEQSARFETERGHLQKKIQQLQKKASELATTAKTHDDQSQVLDEIRESIDKNRQVLKENEEKVGSLIEKLFQDVSPQKLIEEWSDNTPILLLPLRLEIRFKQMDIGQELWVRVFPDEVAVTTHETILTDREYQSGMTYWKALRTASDDETRAAAWRVLADRSGTNRAAWVALQTKPLNWNSSHPPSESNLAFPKPDVTKPDNWTQAPHSTVMPDRFVLIAYRAGKPIHTLVGAQINDMLVLGPAPLDDNGNPSITRDPIDNRLKYGQNFQWVTDFPLAVASGMAFRVPLDAADAAGFDKLLVLGLKLSADEQDGQKLIEELISNHHYSVKGFSLVSQGTATNNSDNNDSHFSSEDWLHGTSNFLEAGDPLFVPKSAQDKATDGQRLAEYLGINYELLQHVSNSDSTDHAEAVAMNRTLFAGSLGYYLHSMLNEVVSEKTIEQLRNFFTKDVSGRGPLPAIRIGNQPYGIIVTSAFAKWAYPHSSIEKDPFEENVRRVLLHLHGQWQTLQPRLVHIGKAGNARENLMSVLGLQPTSADYYQRIGYSYDHIRNLEQFAWGGNYGDDILLLLFEQISGRQFLQSFGYTPTRDDGTLKPVPLLFQLIYQHYHTRLDNRNLIDSLPLSEKRPIKAYHEATGRNYIHWLLENSNNVDKLEQQDFGNGVAKPNALLYMMLHNALLLEAKTSINALLDKHGIVANELVRSRKFMNISSQPDVSHWEVFRAPANLIIPDEVSDRPLLEFIQFERFTWGTEANIGQHLSEVKSALNLLSDLPTARLERLLAEHIDTLNYRLDSWQTALFDRRIQKQRGLTETSSERRMGVFLGNYGYLENVRPAASKRVKLSEESSLPKELHEKKNNLYCSPSNGGYVHTPSINHGTAAAILRNGYLTHATPAERDKLAVNLSSDRVRRAMYLIEGVRNGQSLEVLLGYLFERGLHDWTTRPVFPVILDQLKPVFRKAFPIKKTKLPRQGHPDEPAEVVDDFSVVNGYVLACEGAPFPYAIPDMPQLNNQQITAIEQEKKNIENSLDALRDLLTAESAYQLALGNFDRAAAVMQAVSGGNLPVEIEVIRSSRGTRLGFTNRVVVHFDPSLTTNPWTTIPLTRRALTEPGFNHWTGKLLGDPKKIGCTARAVNVDGIVLLDGLGNPKETLVSLADLSIQPLDFVYLIRNQVQASGYSELESRVRYHFARKLSLSDGTIVKIEFANPGSDPNMRSFAEILPFANAIREMAGKARPLRAQDFNVASKTVAPPSDNPGNINVAELQTRVQGVRSDFDALFSALDTATNAAATLKTELAVEALRKSLDNIANAGFVNVFPFSMVGFGDTERESLLAQAQSLVRRYEVIKTDYDTSLMKVNDPATKPSQKVTLLIQMTRYFFGDDFVVLPKFTFTDSADVLKAFTNHDGLLDYARDIKHIPLPVEEWLYGVSLVRPNMLIFNTVLMLSQTFNVESPPCSPLQLPYKDNDTWLGVEFPEDTTIVHDTLAILQCLPQDFEPTGLQCGLLIDDWPETLPLKEEVTGITFNYDQPNSAPPSAILLAVTPEETGKWKWEHLTDCVLDTIERAKLRAVEPDMIETLNGFATLLPSTIAEFSTSQSTISLDYSLNLAHIYEKVALLSAALKRE